MKPSGGHVGYSYRSDFFDFVDQSSGRSAARFLARLELGFTPRSVLDVGCGRGVWLRAWKDRGVETVVGLDGAYVDRAALQIDPTEFVATDLAEGFDLGRAFDVVQCLEVAEHLPERAADTLVASLARHGDVILFSAATPGQGGEHHVNEQPITYWIAKFASHGYAAFDHPRDAVRGVEDIEPWYRYNTMLFVRAPGEARLSDAARRTAVPRGEAPAIVAPVSWRLRCAALRLLPTPVIHRFAKLKHLLARHGPRRSRRRSGLSA